MTFIDGVTSLGPATVSGGTALIILNQLPRGQHAITAAYSGDTTYGSNLSPTTMFYQSPRPH
jgi:hypothetical protein